MPQACSPTDMGMLQDPEPAAVGERSQVDAGPELDPIVEPPPIPTPGDAAESEGLVNSVKSFFDETVLNLGGEKVSSLDLLTALVIVLLSFQVSRLIQRFSERGFKRLGIESEGTIGTINRLLHYGVVLLGFLMALQQLNIRLEALLAAGAIFAVAFGFAMQNITQNFVSGVILLVERSIKPGDVLEVEGNIVRVVEMGIRSTVARTRDEEEVIVPNSILVQSTVKNYTLRDSLYRLRAIAGVTYDSDMGLVRKTLEECAQELDWREKQRAPRIHLLEFGDNAVIWETSVWIQNPWLAPRLLSRLHETIWWALKDKGIVIAFPQLDVHFDKRLEALLGRVSANAGQAEA